MILIKNGIHYDWSNATYKSKLQQMIMTYNNLNNVQKKIIGLDIDMEEHIYTHLIEYYWHLIIYMVKQQMVHHCGKIMMVV